MPGKTEPGWGRQRECWGEGVAPVDGMGMDNLAEEVTGDG